MKFSHLFIWLIIAFSSSLYAQSEANYGKLDQNIINSIESNPDGYHHITIMLSDYVDVEAMDANFYKLNTPLKERVYTLITTLKAKANETQGPLLNLLKSSDMVDQSSIHPLWIGNFIQARVKKDMVTLLSYRDDIELIEGEKILGITDFKLSPAPFKPMSPNGHESGHDAINAPAFWKMGYTGYGRKVLVIDTGMDYDHPSLISNYYGNHVADSLAWYDSFSSEFPEDCHGHGSHVTGIIVGIDHNTNDTIGVAPAGLWMGSKVIQCYGPGGPNALDVQQWAIDPDGDPNTIDDMPDVINGSYQTPDSFATVGACTGTTKLRLDALEAAGIAMVYGGGNTGFNGPMSMGSQSNINASLVKSFSVGSINGNNPSYPISWFSSRGPSICGGTGAINIKPEVVAPGSNIRSTQLGGGYAFNSGTSMAAPHVSGAILLLKEAFPTLTGTQLKLALYHSAVDLGQTGEDNTYGNGLIDVVAAYNYLIGEGHTPFALPPANVEVEGIVNLGGLTAGCDSVYIGSITVKNNGTVALTSLDFNYTYSDGSGGTHQWTGNLAPGQTGNIVLPAQQFPLGFYSIDVELLQVNGASEYYNLDNKASSSFFLAGVTEITSDPVNACKDNSTMILASSSDPNSVIKWFADATSTTPLGEGNAFITPPLSSTTPYYLGAFKQTKVGKEDNSGTGIMWQAQGAYLTFDVNAPVFLKSVFSI